LRYTWSDENIDHEYLNIIIILNCQILSFIAYHLDIEMISHDRLTRRTLDPDDGVPIRLRVLVVVGRDSSPLRPDCVYEYFQCGNLIMTIVDPSTVLTTLKL
jgi:hypothetical protein